MRICHVTPHLPPDQAANALLPWHLGHWSVAAGHTVEYLAHPPRAGAPAVSPGPVEWIPARVGAGLVRRVSSLWEAQRILRAARLACARADIVHVHSNGLLSEVAALAARRRHTPTVLTLYGTEIWHYERKFPLDLFTRMYRGAAYVTFYSDKLRERAADLGLDGPDTATVYPPVSDAFEAVSPARRTELRRDLGLETTHVLLNVKRLHPLAGQRHLIDAMPRVLADHPSTTLVICGSGPLEDDLKARARALGVDRHVRFAGLVDNHTVAHYDAVADAFVLPSVLEACPTVALEALACGTPVVSADHPGGVELQGLFGPDVALVPRENPEALAEAIGSLLRAPRRTRPQTQAVLSREFRPPAVAARFHAIYERLVTSSGTGHLRARPPDSRRESNA